MVFIDLVKLLISMYICFIIAVVLTGFLYNYYSFVESSGLERLKFKFDEVSRSGFPGDSLRELEIVYTKIYTENRQWIINILFRNNGFRGVVIESVLINNRLYFFYPGIELSEYPDIYIPAGSSKEFNITIKQFIGTGFRSGDTVSITFTTPSKEAYKITIVLP